MVISRILAAVLLPLVLAPLAHGDTVEWFGLHHSTLGHATLGSNIYDTGFTVENLNHFGDDGVATELGEADSGAFFYPNTSQVSEGYFMRGRAYGSVNGQRNTFIGSLGGYRAGYATFFVTADYSSLGATNLTFQLWNGGVLISETTASLSDEVRIITESFSSPRANPWWRQTNGEYGASIELRYPAQMMLPGCNDSSCEYVYADQIFIRPNGATSVVEYVSRTDVFGGGGLETFSYDALRLGMFHRPHAALGDAKMVARNGTLKMAEIPPDTENGGGVMAEFSLAAMAQINFLPIDLAIPNTNDVRHRLEISASGSMANSFGFLGAITLINSNGVLELSTYVFDRPTATIQIFSNSVLMGSSPVAAYENVRVDGARGITSAGANADLISLPAGLFVGFESNATFIFSNGTHLVGNKAVVNAGEHLGFADVTAISILAHDIPSFTIVGESSQPAAAPRLDIFLSGGQAILRWPDPARAFNLEYKPNLDTYFSPVELTIEHTNGVTTAAFSMSESAMGFFRLQRYSFRYGD